MSDEPAVLLENTSKIYKLQETSQQKASLGSLFGFRRRGTEVATQGGREFVALDGVNLRIERGERIGLIGRNGAGKTTLLKLLCGNFAPTSGRVTVNGQIQALMTMGTGFHPDHSGRRNTEMSLKYNNLSADEQALAVQDVEEFCELGQFFDQPFKVYSQGMQARLMFAVATAVKPEILMVDEVLGAGDAYFVAKSKLRVERLVKTGCTMILVSHSMPQILELCTRAVWLDAGKVRMIGDAFIVVKAYEEFMHGPISAVTVPEIKAETLVPMPPENPSSAKDVRSVSLPANVHFQEPPFVPHADEPVLPALADVSPSELMFQAQGGLSRWDSSKGVKITGFSVVTERGICNELVVFRPAMFVFTIVAEESGSHDLRYGMVVNDHMGNCLTRFFSPRDSFTLQQGGVRQVRMLLNPNQLGPGVYVVGISILRYGPLEAVNFAERFDLLSRSFEIKVVLPDSLAALGSSFLHSAEWRFGDGS